METSLESRSRSKKAKKERSNITKVVLQEADATVDYPQADEVVTSRSYSIRISAPETSKVDVPLDNGPWEPCRFSAGHWWYDWSGYMSGKHQVRAQVHVNGHVVISSSRRFTVSLEQRPDEEIKK